VTTVEGQWNPAKAYQLLAFGGSNFEINPRQCIPSRLALKSADSTCGKSLLS
jgi:hypothetical protein